MKTKIKVKKINDPDTDVTVNSGEHRIDEIKREIAECAGCQTFVKAEVVEMWENLPPNKEPDE